jgi:hypothetical protein
MLDSQPEKKSSKLRANPKISEVEIISVDPTCKMTAYGSPYEGERTEG